MIQGEALLRVWVFCRTERSQMKKSSWDFLCWMKVMLFMGMEQLFLNFL